MSGRLVALLADEALEQHAHARGVDLGDAERVAHRGIGGGPAALAEDLLAAREGDDVLDRKEVRFVRRSAMSASSCSISSRTSAGAWSMP
jgi:hypothetical protein